MTDIATDERGCPLVEMDAAVFREEGYLYEINRLILHPLGLDLIAARDVFGSETLRVRDLRFIAGELHYEGLRLEDGDLRYVQGQGDAGPPVDTPMPRLDLLASEIERRGPARMEALGYVIQPLPPEVKQLHVTVRETVALPGEVVADAE